MNKYLLTAMNWENLTLSELSENVNDAEDNFDMEVGSYIFDICNKAVRLKNSLLILESHMDRPSCAFYNNSVELEKKNINFHGWKDIFNGSKDSYFRGSIEKEEDYLNKIKEINSD